MNVRKERGGLWLNLVLERILATLFVNKKACFVAFSSVLIKARAR